MIYMYYDGRRIMTVMKHDISRGRGVNPEALLSLAVTFVTKAAAGWRNPQLSFLCLAPHHRRTRKLFYWGRNPV